MSGRLWTDQEVGYACQISWDLGRYHERQRIATAQAELDALWPAVGRKAYEDRVAERIAEMERFDVAAWLAECRRLDEVRDRQAIELGERIGPVLRTYRDAHANVTPSVWLRIWGDLADRTRAELADLNPAGPRRRLEIAA